MMKYRKKMVRLFGQKPVIIPIKGLQIPKGQNFFDDIFESVRYKGKTGYLKPNINGNTYSKRRHTYTGRYPTGQ
jgi:hypothetical protein